jgi:hypothetical protein
MNNKEILDNAPEGATHLSEDYGLLYLQADPDAYVSSYSNFRWNDNDVKTELLHFHTVRSLADIKRIAELENIINAQVFPSSGDGFSSEYIKGYEKALSDLDKILKEQE